MQALLMIAALGMIALGYLVMSRIDRFIENGGFVDSQQGRANRGVLVYAAPEMVIQMQKAGMKCTAIDTPNFPEDGFYSAVFALSRNDRENLAICRAAKRFDLGIYMVARCSEPELYEAFEAAGIHRILNAGESAYSLLAELRGEHR